MASTCIKLNNGHCFPFVGLGTWMAPPGEVGAALKIAIKAGYRHIDCAYIYKNEAEIGQALKEIFEEKIVKREELFIVSKLWGTKHHKDDVEPSLKKSLSKLQLNYLDLYLIHWPVGFKRGDVDFPENEKGDLLFEPVDHMDTWKAMEGCVAKGLVRSIGLSNFNSKQIQNVLDYCSIKPSVLQIEAHPYLSQEELVNFCKKNQIVVTAYSSLGSNQRPWATTKDPILLEDPVLKGLAAKHNRSVAQIILRWLVQRDIVVIPKSTNEKRIKENLDLFSFKLSESDMDDIKKLNKDIRFIVPQKNIHGKFVPWDSSSPNYPFNVPF